MKQRKETNYRDWLIIVFTIALLLHLICNRNPYRKVIDPKRVISYSEIITHIKYHEGFRSKKYRCAGGVWTIGYGHLWRKGNPDVWTKSYADSVFRIDFLEKYNQLDRYSRSIQRQLTQSELYIFTSLAFNCGISASKKVISSGDNSNLLKYVYAGGKVVEGLVLRRKKEYQMLVL